MSKLLRAGIVSATGSGRKRTIPALSESSKVVVSAIHGRDDDKLISTAEGFSIDRHYADLSTMIAERQFDFAIVCSPPFMHVEQVVELTASGIPCLVEKPAALRAVDVRTMLEAAGANKVEVRVANHLRFTPMFRNIFTLVRSGDLGDLRGASMEWSFCLNRSAASADWKLDPLLNGPTCITDAGIHCLDAAVALLGPGVLREVFFEDSSDDRTIEQLLVLTKHGDVLSSTSASRRYGPFSNLLRITGLEGEVVVPRFFGEIPATEGTVYIRGESRPMSAQSANPYLLEVEDFADLLLGDDSGYAATLYDAYEVAKITDKVASRLAQDGRIES